ncbi:MAG: hypothetical protein FWG77_08020 [Treponema sp.]|nr:hypothetical protein [Treponema sp.]
MKYFISTLLGSDSGTGNCLLGIPSESTERIIQAEQNDEVFISIPALLKLKDKTTHHALVLKSKKVLLLPKIDVELEIPEEEIQVLPKTVAELFNYFRGVYLGQSMILILDPEKLPEHSE